MTRPAEREERFADWVDGRMSARERQRFESEMRVNEDLRIRVEEYRKTVELVRRALAEPEEPVDLADRVMAALPRRRAGGRLLLGRFGPVFASAAAAAVLIGAFLFLNQWENDVVPDAGLTRTARSETGTEGRFADEDEMGEVSDAVRPTGGSKDGSRGFGQKGAFDDRAPRPSQTAAGEGQVLGQTDDKAVEEKTVGTDSLNRRDLRLVLDELAKTPAAEPSVQDREVGAVQRRQRQAPAEQTPVVRGGGAGRGGAAPSPPATVKAAAEPVAEQRKEQAASQPPAEREQIVEHAEKQIAVFEQLEQAEPSQPQLQVLNIGDLAPNPGGVSLDTETATRAGYFSVERALPVVTVNVDPARIGEVPLARTLADPVRGSEDFFMGNQNATPKALVLPQGGWATFFDDNAVAIQAPSYAFRAFGGERDEPRTKAEADAAAGIVQLQQLPQRWIQFGQQPAQQQLKALQARSYLVEGTEPAVRGMLSSLRSWAEQEKRAELQIGQVAEAQVIQALDSLQGKYARLAPDTGEPESDHSDEANKKAAQRQDGVAAPTPGPAGPTAPGPAGAAEGRRTHERGRGAPPPAPPAEQTPEDSAVLRRILLVFQERPPATDPGAAGKNR